MTPDTTAAAETETVRSSKFSRPASQLLRDVPTTEDSLHLESIKVKRFKIIYLTNAVASTRNQPSAWPL